MAIKVVELPSGFEVIASNASCPIAAMANIEQKLYGVQFHPEFTSTPRDGHPLFSAFINAALLHQVLDVKKSS